MCLLAAFNEHVAINFFAPPDVLVDPDKELEGGGKGNRMLKVRGATDINSAAISRCFELLRAVAGLTDDQQTLLSPRLGVKWRGWRSPEQVEMRPFGLPVPRSAGARSRAPCWTAVDERRSPPRLRVRA